MTEQEAYGLGQTTASVWTLEGWTSGKNLSRGARAAGAVLRRTAQEQGEAGPVTEQLWQIERAVASVCSAFDGCGPLPALRMGGRSARLQVLGEALGMTEAAASRGTLTACLRGVQEVQTLTEQELSLLIPGLRLGLLLNLSHSVQDPAQTDVLLERLAQLQTLDLMGIVEELSPVHQVFSQDPVYLEMEEGSRACYRSRLARLAKQHRHTEVEEATQIMDEAKSTGQHLGFLLFPDHTGKDEWYPLLLVLGTLGLSGLATLGTGSLWCGLLLVLPLSQVLKQLVDFVLLHVTPVRPVVRLDLRKDCLQRGGPSP